MQKKLHKFELAALGNLCKCLFRSNSRIFWLFLSFFFWKVLKQPKKPRHWYRRSKAVSKMRNYVKFSKTLAPNEVFNIKRTPLCIDNSKWKRLNKLTLFLLRLDMKFHWFYQSPIGLFWDHLNFKKLKHWKHFMNSTVFRRQLLQMTTKKCFFYFFRYTNCCPRRPWQNVDWHI